MTAAGFKRMWETPRRCSRGGLLDYPTPQQRYLRIQSYARYRRRPDAYAPGTEPRYDGELGHIDSFRFITSRPAPDPVLVITTPDGYIDRMRTIFQEAHRTGVVLIGMDFADGPDWSVIQDWRRPDPPPPAPALTLLDLQQITRAELKRGRRADKLRQMSARGAIARG